MRCAGRPHGGPSETGFSKRVFFVERVTADDVVIGNRARYAGWPEAGVPNESTRNACRDTLRAARRRIIAAGEDAVADVLPTDDEAITPDVAERLVTGRGAGLSQRQRRALTGVVRAHRTRERARLATATRLQRASAARAGVHARYASRLLRLAELAGRLR